MASVPEAVIDSVKSLGLNGSSKDANGSIGDVVVKNICCVGAGYVGESLLVSPQSTLRVLLPTCRGRAEALSGSSTLASRICS